MDKAEQLARKSAEKNGRSFVKRGVVGNFVEFVYCNGQAICTIKLPVNSYDEKKVRKLWNASR